MWKHRLNVPAVEPEPPAPSGFVPRGDQRLDDSIVERLAIALHERWCGRSNPEGGKAECARRSGAFDDIYAIEPELLALLKGRPA